MTFLVDSWLSIHFLRGLNSISWLSTCCIINLRLHTPLSPLISHRCQKEACTEIKGRIWALCSKIKLSVVIFYITFRTAYWKMLPLLGLLQPLLLSRFPSPFFFPFSVFFSSYVSSQITFSLCQVLERSLLACKVPPLTIRAVTSPQEQLFKSTSRPRTQHNSPRFLHMEIVHCSCICNVTAVFNLHLPHSPQFSRSRNQNPGTF